MDAERKVINGVFPVTTTKAVFIDGTGKTLQEAIDNGELGGGNANVDIDQSNLIWDIFMQNGSVSFPRKDLITKEVDIKLDSSAPTDHALRLMPVIMANGTTKAAANSFGLLSATEKYTLKNGESLIYDSATNQTQVSTSFITNGSKKLLAYNNAGVIAAGLFKDCFERHYHAYIDRYLNINMTTVPNVSYFHSMFVMGNKLVTLEVSSLGKSNVYDLSNFENDNTITHSGSFQVEFLGTNSNGSEFEYRLVASDYSEEHQALVFGNSTALGVPDNMNARIFYEVEDWFNSKETINFDNCGTNTLVTFDDELLGSLKQAKVCWDTSSSNCLWLTAENGLYIFRILLGKGSNRLENGDYVYIDDNKFNGTYKILSCWRNQIHDYGCKDLTFANGCIIHPIKKTTGGIYFQKVQLCHDNNTSVRVERFLYNPVDENGTSLILGSPEGIVYYKGKLIIGHASYKNFYIIDANI